MAAAPSPVSLINHRAMANIKVDLTPEGMQAFEILFPAALGPLLATTLRRSLQNACKAAGSQEENALFNMIYDQLIICLSNEPKVLVTLHSKARGHGPLAFQWLQERYNPNTQITHVKTLLDIFATASVETDDEVEDIITKNTTLPTTPNLQLDDGVMAILIISKLSSVRFKPIKDNFIIGTNIPPIAELQAQIAAINQYTGTGNQMAFMASGQRHLRMCFNCDQKVYHSTKDCDKPKANCDTCGPAAGHLSKHCLVRSDKPIPSTLPEHIQASIQAKRDALHAKSNNAANVANACIPIDDEMDENEFFKLIEGKNK
jgi:hypothetical protein